MRVLRSALGRYRGRPDRWRCQRIRQELRQHAAHTKAVAILAQYHPLARKLWLAPKDFAGETLISYPVNDEMHDVVATP